MLLAIKRIRSNFYDLILVLLPCFATAILLQAEDNHTSLILKFWIYYLAAVVPVSHILSSILLRDYDLSLMQKIALGYAPTVVLFSLGYILLEVTGLASLSFLMPVGGLLWLARRGKRRDYEITSEPPKSGLALCISLSIIYILASAALYCGFTLNALPPSLESGGNLYQDTAWSIGNTWSILKNGFPVQDLRFADVPLGYHLGQNIYYAYISKLTGIDPVFLHLRIAPFFEMFFLCASVVSAFNVFIGGPARSSSLLLLPVLLAGREITPFGVGAPINYDEIYTNPISLAFGLGHFLVLFIILGRQYEWGKLGRKVPYYYTLIVFTLVVSTKGILGVLIPGSIIVFITIRWMHKKVSIKACDIKLLISMAMIVLLLKQTMFMGSGGWIVPPQIEVSPNALAIAEQLGVASQVSNSYFLIGPISRMTRFLFHIVLWNWSGVALILGLFMFAKLTLGRISDLQFPRISAAFICVCSFFYGINIMENFWANIYYYNYSLALITLALGITLVQMLELSLSEQTHIMSSRFISGLGVLAMLTPSVVDLKAKISNELNKWKNAHPLMLTGINGERFLSLDEYKGLIWMKNNLTNSAVIASDRRDKAGAIGDHKFSVWFNYSAYSGLQFYNEGEAFNQYQVAKVSSNRWNNVNNLLKSLNRDEAVNAWNKIDADYLIITRRVSPDSFKKLFLGTTVFKNKDIRLIKNPKYRLASNSQDES